MPQLRAFAVFLASSAIIIAVFVWVALSTRAARQVDMKSAYRLRRRVFVVLGLLLLATLALTLPRLPYPDESQQPDQVVFVATKQFAFGISDKPITREDELDAATTAEPVKVSAGRLVEFRVSTLDVNHGFSVFSPEGALLAQTQAMPGYVNRLRLRLDRPGRYNVFCLELCGMSHHRMRGVFDVAPSRLAAQP